MIKRPTRIDNEYDLLREQEAFLNDPKHEIGVRLVKQKKKDLVQQPVYESARIVQDRIIEKPVGNDFEFDFAQWSNDETGGFPPVFDVDPNDNGSLGCSLFLKYLPQKLSKIVEKVDDSNYLQPLSVGKQHDIECLTPFIRLKNEIHEENLLKMNAMSAAEIIEEQKLLIEKLDPELVKFIKSRHNRD